MQDKMWQTMPTSYQTAKQKAKNVMKKRGQHEETKSNRTHALKMELDLSGIFYFR